MAKEHREVDYDWKKIANKVLENEPTLADVKNSQASIIYLTSDYKKTSKGKVTCALTEVMPERNKWAADCDYTITIYLPNVEGFTEEQKYILMYHELLHIVIEHKDDKEVYGTRPHDYADFKEIIDKYGTDWAVVK